MLKGTPADRMEEVKAHQLKLTVYVFLISLVLGIAIFVARHNDLPGGWLEPGFMLFFAAATIFSALISVLFWSPLALWLGGVGIDDGLAAFEAPDKNPQAVDRFLEGWWRNETVLAVFTVLVRVVVGVGLYRLVGPFLGLW